VENAVAAAETVILQALLRGTLFLKKDHLIIVARIEFL
jgi:hypothetical protein